MMIADQFPRTNLTVGQPVGLLDRILIAAAVMPVPVAIDVGVAVHHKESISGPLDRTARQDLDRCSSDAGTSGHDSGGRSSHNVSLLFFLRLSPLSPSSSERNQGSQVLNPHKKRGSFWGILLLHGSRNPGSRATLKYNFLWNFGISENRVASLSAWVICLDGVIWPLDAISVMTARG